MASLSALTSVNLKVPQIWPRGQGFDPAMEDFRDAVNDALGDIINIVNILVEVAAIGSIGAGFDGGDSVITAGAEVEVSVPFSGTIVACVVVGDQTGSIEIEVEKATYDNYDTLTSIVASAPPTISAAKKSSDTTLTGWTTAVVAGDIFRFSVTSVSTLTRAEIALYVEKSS
jgi:hypothetical protein